MKLLVINLIQFRDSVPCLFQIKLRRDTETRNLRIGKLSGNHFVGLLYGSLRICGNSDFNELGSG